MSWGPITSTDVEPRLSGAELKALQTKVLADGQTDPITPVIADTVEEVRGHIASYSGDGSLGAAGTIPARLRAATIAVIAFRLTLRLPVETSDPTITAARRSEAEAAFRLFSKVESGDYVVDQPEASVSSTGSWGSHQQVRF